MEIRPIVASDLAKVFDIDGTIESEDYFHITAEGEGALLSWGIQHRPLRSKLIEPNRLDDDTTFTLKQIATGADEGLCLVAEHEGALVALLLAQSVPDQKILRIIDLRVDFDFRRQGIGTALLFRTVQHARDNESRAVMTATRTNNLPASRFLIKGAFDLTGIDSRFYSNHDLVKDSVAMFWYASLA